MGYDKLTQRDEITVREAIDIIGGRWTTKEASYLLRSIGFRCERENKTSEATYRRRT